MAAQFGQFGMALVLLSGVAAQADAAAGGSAPAEKDWFGDLFYSSPPPPSPDGDLLRTIAMPMMGFLGFGEASPPAPPPTFLTHLSSISPFERSPPPAPPEPGFFFVTQDSSALEKALPFHPQEQGQPAWPGNGPATPIDRLSLVAEPAARAPGSLTPVAGQGSLLGVGAVCLAVVALILAIRRSRNAKSTAGASPAVNLV